MTKTTIETQQQLTADARERHFKPGALCLRMFIEEPVLLTSWPWFDTDGVARIMARLDQNDIMSNRSIRYFTVIRKIGEQDL